jgi:hypothetical protein
VELCSSATDGTRTGDAATCRNKTELTAAEFTVNGETDFTFDIALPAGSFDVKK